MRFVEPDDARRARFLADMGRLVVSLVAHRGEVWGAGEPLSGVALWTVGPLTTWDWATHGFAGLALRAPSRLGRMLKNGAAIDRLHARCVSGPHDYLVMLAVDQAARGQGLATQLVRARREGSARPTYLETANPKNVQLYAHLGFEVKARERLDAATELFGMLAPALRANTPAR